MFEEFSKWAEPVDEIYFTNKISFSIEKKKKQNRNCWFKKNAAMDEENN